MPHGFFTLEQWTPSTPANPAQWAVVSHFESDRSLSEVIEALDHLGRPGLYRVIQTQRVIWAEKKEGTMRLRKSHAGSAASLTKLAAAFERDQGVWPEAEAREIRARIKRERS